MLKDSFRRFIISKKVLAKGMFYYYKFKGKNKNVIESNKRKNHSIFDYKQLIGELPYSPHETVIDNNFYGNAYSLKEYLGYRGDFNAYMEHGLYFGNLVHKDEQKWYTNKIITLSENRERHITAKLTNKHIIKIGPYIHYAKSVLSDVEYEKTKQEIGKTLLVFPSHSVKNVQLKYDVDEFTKEIEKIKGEYNTVLICLFYLDAQNRELVAKYENLGYRIVTSGHRFDNYFLDRQKTIISLADMTMSNRMGTHVGYCVYMNKPHYLFQQKSDYHAENRKEAERVINARTDDELLDREREIKDIGKYFSKFSTSISEDQKKIIDKYWGTSCIKSKEELLELLNRV